MDPALCREGFGVAVRGVLGSLPGGFGVAARGVPAFPSVGAGRAVAAPKPFCFRFHLGAGAVWKSRIAGRARGGWSERRSPSPIPGAHPTGESIPSSSSSDGDGTGDGSEAPSAPGPFADAAAPPREEEEDEDEDDGEDDEDFQFLLCEGCGQDSAHPRLLGCLHTLCPGCLSDAKQCPRCQGAAAAPAVDNLLFSNLRSRLELWKQIRSSRGPCCGRCRAEEALVWCEECEEFLCGRCSEEHRWWHKKKEHRFLKVEELRAGSARSFLRDTKTSCSLFCSSSSHPQESRVCRWVSCPEIVPSPKFQILCPNPVLIPNIVLSPNLVCPQIQSIRMLRTLTVLYLNPLLSLNLILLPNPILFLNLVLSPNIVLSPNPLLSLNLILFPNSKSCP
ncbi:protein PML [Parus major]|uniref:protein PML n=1 Tax=Parus major TaxID=9157 RepID=UPI001443ABDF|nr:protein PML [Parus major]